MKLEFQAVEVVKFCIISQKHHKLYAYFFIVKRLIEIKNIDLDIGLELIAYGRAVAYVEHTAISNLINPYKNRIDARVGYELVLVRQLEIGCRKAYFVSYAIPLDYLTDDKIIMPQVKGSFIEVACFERRPYFGGTDGDFIDLLFFDFNEFEMAILFIFLKQSYISAPIESEFMVISQNKVGWMKTLKDEFLDVFAWVHLRKLKGKRYDDHIAYTTCFE